MKEKMIVVNKKFRPACFRQYYCEKTCKHCPWKKKCNNSKKQINSWYGQALWKSLTENKNSFSSIPEETFIKHEDDMVI